VEVLKITCLESCVLKGLTVQQIDVMEGTGIVIQECQIEALRINTKCRVINCKIGSITVNNVEGCCFEDNFISEICIKASSNCIFSRNYVVGAIKIQGCSDTQLISNEIVRSTFVIEDSKYIELIGNQITYPTQNGLLLLGDSIVCCELNQISNVADYANIALKDKSGVNLQKNLITDS
jgi:hypothetical protein